jgi:hypothetical protein
MMEAVEKEEDIVFDESADEMIAIDELPVDTDRGRNPDQFSNSDWNPATGMNQSMMMNRE